MQQTLPAFDCLSTFPVKKRHFKWLPPYQTREAGTDIIDLISVLPPVPSVATDKPSVLVFPSLCEGFLECLTVLEGCRLLLVFYAHLLLLHKILY